MRQAKRKILFILVFLAGVSILLYPTVSEHVNAKHQSTVVASYETALAQAPDETLARAQDSAEEFNRLFFQYAGESYGNISASMDKRYWTELNLDGDGVMGYLNIPCINVSLPIAHGGGEQTLQNSAGHLECSSLPVGGADTHCVLFGHRGLPSSVLFTNLDQLGTGDQIYLHVLGQTLAYEVYDVEIVLPEETDSLAIARGQDRLTLITCTPYGINTHRILVHAQRVPYVQQTEQDTPTKSNVNMIFRITCALLGGGVLAAMLMVWLIPRHYRHPKGGKRLLDKDKKE